MGRKNPSCEQACRFVSRRVKTDLKAAIVEVMESGGGQAQVAPGFQQAESNISEGADAVGEGNPEQAAFFDQLKDQMGNLEQEIKHLSSSTILAVRVFEIVAAIFLDIEAFRMKLRSQFSNGSGRLGWLRCQHCLG